MQHTHRTLRRIHQMPGVFKAEDKRHGRRKYPDATTPVSVRFLHSVILRAPLPPRAWPHKKPHKFVFPSCAVLSGVIK